MKTTPIAKIARPKLSGIVKRDRLFRLLDQGKQKPVIWITAQGGSGKTTLVADWVDTRKFPCLWYQIDEGDADIASFFYYMGMAAKHAAPRYKNSLPLLTPEYLQGIPVFTRRYFEALFSRLSSPTLTKGGEGGFVVVLDNYQDAPLASGFHDMIAHGLETIPEGITVIIQSRAVPPPQFARLQANNQLHPIGWDDVRFSREESLELLGTQGYGKLPVESLDRLHKKTEGWAAGLILLAGAGAETSVSKPLADMTAGKLFDYFASEIFSKKDASIQDVLLKTSFLQKIDPATAEQLTGNTMAGQILERLSRNHYFTQKYDHAYQYHPLFREFLQNRAKAILAPACMVSVQQKAAELMEQSGSAEEAVELYIAATDWNNAERVILKQAQVLVSQGRCNVLEGWLDRYPSEHIEASPWALYWLGICRLAYSPAEAREHFEKAFLLFKNNVDVAGLFLSWAYIVDTIIYEWSDFRPLDHWVAEADDLIAQYPEFPSVEIEARVVGCMLGAMTWRRLHPDLPLWAERAKQIVLHHPSAELRLTLGSNLLHYYFQSGELIKAGLLLDVLRPFGKSKGSTPLTRLNWLTMDTVYFWWMADSAACMPAVSEGLEYAQEYGIHMLDLFLLAHGVYCGVSTGDLATARAYLAKMAEINSPRLIDKALYHCQAASVAWCGGDLKKAIEHGELFLQIGETTGCKLPQMALELSLTYFDDGQREKAKRLLAMAQEVAVVHGMKSVTFTGLIYEARFAFDSGEEESGFAALRQGLALGSLQGYVNMFRWNNRTMSRLCAKALERDIETEYVRHLVLQRGLEPEIESRHLENWPWEIRIHALGQFTVTIGDEPLRSSGKQQRKPLELLQLLVSAGERGLPVDQLAESLWPDMEGDKAYNAHTSAVYRLRKLVGSEDAILTQNGRVALNPRRCFVDAWAFEHLLAQAAQQRTANPGETSRLLMRAIGVYRGAFLNDEQTGEWAMGCRERLHGKFVRAVLDVGRRLEEMHDYDQALDCYQRGLDRDDLAEALCQRILVCCRELGRRAEGIAAFERCRRRLLTLLDVSPSAQTFALRDLLIAG